MTRLLLAAVAVVASGCAQGSVGPYVRNLTVTGNTLIVQRCNIILSGNHLSEGRCIEERYELPIRPRSVIVASAPERTLAPITKLAPAPTSARTAGEITAALRAARSSLLECGAKYQVTGRVTIAVTVSAQGRVAKVASTRGSDDFAACLHHAFREVQMKADEAETKFRYPLIFPEPAP